MTRFALLALAAAAVSFPTLAAACERHAEHRVQASATVEEMAPTVAIEEAAMTTLPQSVIPDDEAIRASEASAPAPYAGCSRAKRTTVYLTQ